MFSNLILFSGTPLNALNGHYDLLSLAISFVIATLACYVALDMAVQLRRETLSRLRTFWHIGGAVVLGCGIWAMHFTGMLAYQLELEHNYTLPMTLLSLGIAIGFSLMVFQVISRTKVTRKYLLINAPLLGLGLALMLYIGTGAMQLRGTLHFTVGWFAESLLLAMAATAIILRLAVLAPQQKASRIARFNFLSALLLAFTLCAMQYTATRATVVVPFIDGRMGPEFDEINSLLALAIGVVTLMILGIALAALFLSQKMTEHLKIEVAKRTDELERSSEELRVAKEQAEEASLAKTEFLANMSHEIRTPINAVVGIANILNADMLPPEKRKEYLTTLQLSAESLLGLINELLDISKIETNKVELEQEPFDLHGLIDEVIMLISVRANEKGLTIKLDYENACPRHYVGDALRVRQILVNILSNAVKFTEVGGITIHVAGSPGRMHKTDLRIRISDTGIGIPTDKLGHIFDKFIQADTSHSRKYGGTGLGLSISRGLAERMDGTITVASQVGKGSEFIIHLLLSQADSKPELRPTSLSKPALVSNNVKTLAEQAGEDKPRPRILLVEDNAANILVAKSYLDIFGFEHEVAHNGEEGVEKHLAKPFDLILMDVQMPVMDGYEATRRIREWEKETHAHHTPIIAMTSHGRIEDRDRCLRMGMDEYIPKPFRPDDLKEKILGKLKVSTAA